MAIKDIEEMVYAERRMIGDLKQEVKRLRALLLESTVALANMAMMVDSECTNEIMEDVYKEVENAI